MRPDKVQNSINQQPLLLYKLDRRLRHGDDVTSQDAQFRRLVEHLLPDVAHDYPGADGEHDLQGVEAEAAQPKEENGLVGLYLSAAGDGVVGRVHGVGGYGRLGRCDTLFESDMRSECF